MSDISQEKKALVTRILEGDGKASPAERQAAFQNKGLAGPAGMLVEKIAKHAHRISDEDINAVRISCLSEDQIFEVAVCAAVGQAARQYDTGLAALEAVSGKE